MAIVEVVVVVIEICIMTKHHDFVNGTSTLHTPEYERDGRTGDRGEGVGGRTSVAPRPSPSSTL